MEFATHNVRLNGFKQVAGFPVDWHEPPTDLKFELILGSDVAYEPTNHELLFQTVDALLTPTGEFWLTDPDRKQSPPFFDMLRNRGWKLSRKVVHAASPGEDRIRGSLYRITRPSHKPS